MTMRVIPSALRAALLLPSAFSFSFSTTTRGIPLACVARNPTAFIASRPLTATTPLRMSDDNDFYSDYDPSAYSKPESSSYSSNDNNSYSSRGGGGGGGRGGYSSRGGGGGGNYNADYTRDTSRDTSNVDEGAVMGLLQERTSAKKRRDYDTADAIRDQLMNDYSVAVFDKDRSWRTGASRSGSGGGNRGMGGGGGRQDRGGGQRGGGRRDRDFGPTGHDYEKSHDAGPIQCDLTEDQINAMIAERLMAKLNKNYQVADEIQVELVDAGIFVHDKMKEWRADGVPFADFTNGSRSIGSPDKHRSYVVSPHSEDATGNEDQIATLVEERNTCKARRNYQDADAIREELKDDFNVIIDDRTKEWSVGGNFGEEHNAQRELSFAVKNRGYVRSTSSKELSDADEIFVQEKIDERTDAKKARNFNVADAIRDELANDFDITINDRIKQWSAGGDFGDDVAPKREYAAYRRRGGGNLSDEEVDTINSMIVARGKAKKDRNFDYADEIRSNLRDTYNVYIDDKTRDWRIESDEYVQVGSELGAQELSPDQAQIVQKKVEERFAFKRSKDYDAADALRDELQDGFSVFIDDRTKEWKVTMSVGKNGGYNDSFAQEAQGSQASPFKRQEMGMQMDDEVDAIFDTKDNTPEISITNEEEASSSDNILSEDELSSLTVPELKEKLKAVGLPVSGRKAELIERLL